MPLVSTHFVRWIDGQGLGEKNTTAINSEVLSVAVEIVFTQPEA